MITGHGDDAYVYNKNIIANFSSNVYYDGFPDGLRDQLIATIAKINTYPEANADSLCGCLAEWHNLAAEQVLVTNGATEAFYLIAQSLRNKRVTIIIPSFAEYEDACRAADLSLEFLDWNELHLNTRFTTDAVFLGNPNNPTGSIFKKKLLHFLLQNNPQTTFVIDEAYVDFTPEPVSMVDELIHFPNLIIVKSLTKTHAIPGLRLGYILSNPTVIKHITFRKMPWSVNTMAIEAGKYIIHNRLNFPLPLEQLLTDTQQLIHQLSKQQQLKITPTRTNFFLCETKSGTAADLKSFLVNEYGILIRDASNFRGLSNRHFRIATQTAAKNELLINAVEQWIMNN